jgi:hypothetical protein
MLVCEKGLYLHFVGVGLFFGFAFQMVRIVLNIYNYKYWLEPRETVCFVDAERHVNISRGEAVGNIGVRKLLE